MKKIYILAVAAIALTACDKNEDYPVNSSVEAKIFATIGGTRASDSSWAPNDTIGITVTGPNNVLLKTNLKYTTEKGDGNFTGETIYFYNPMSFTAYYPFTGSEGTAPGTISAETKASNQTEDNQPKIDFLWTEQPKIDVADNKPVVNFNFAHKMSKITLNFINGNKGTDVSKIVSYSIDGLVLKGTFDTNTGECKVNTDDPESLIIDLNGENAKYDKDEHKLNLNSLIVFPQNPGSDKVILHIYANEIDNKDYLQHYSCSFSFPDGELKPGMNYQYTITVSKAGLAVNFSIIDWFPKKLGGEAMSDDDDD